MTFRRGWSYFAGGLLGTAGLVALTPGAAFAVGGNVHLTGGTLVVNVDTTGDQVSLLDSGPNVRVAGQKGMLLTGGGPCAQLNPSLVQCPKAAVTSYTLTGSGQADTVFADSFPVSGDIDLGGGNDYLQVGRGDDDIHGGAGTDQVSYNVRDYSVSVSMDDVANDGELNVGEADDIHSDVEVVFGGNGDDVFRGNASRNEFRGMFGNDKFYGSVGASDLFEGYLGFDIVEYDVATPLTIDLLGEEAAVGPSQTDTLFTLEMAVGGTGDDIIRGDDGPNRLVGGGGNDFIRGLGGEDVLFASGDLSTVVGDDGDDLLLAYQGTGKQLQGGAGSDTVSYAGYVEWDFSTEDYATAPVTADLDGQADDGYAGQKDKIATDVENLTGTHFGGDKLTGNTAANELVGYGGDDTLSGAGGNDVLAPQRVMGTGSDKDVVSGGAGTDAVTYAGTSADLNVTINNVANDGPAGDLDNVKSDVEVVQGGSGDDTLTGGGSANTLLGGSGNDTLRGLGGNDVLDGQTGSDAMIGGTGLDTASYAGRFANLQVTIDGGVGDGEIGENDNVAGDVENLVGGSGDDYLRGSSGANTISGGAGNDTVSGLGGNDVINLGDGDDVVDTGGVKDGADKISGGDGHDTVDYGSRFAPIIVTINGSGGDGQAGENDTVKTDVEVVRGGPFADKLTGGAGPETLYGGGDADVLKGGAGDDALYGEAGDDTLDGGLGTDLADGGLGTDTCSNAETVVACES